MSTLSACIVSCNTHNLLRACLDSLAVNPPDAVIVVDNNSSDGTVEMLRRDYPHVTLCLNARNLGYGAAANQAIAMSGTDHVLLLNSDTRVAPDALSRLRDVLDQQADVAIVGPRLCNDDGSLQPSCFHFPTPLEVFLDVANAARVIRRIPRLRDMYLRSWMHAEMREVDWVSGAALAIRRRAFDAVHGFDPAFVFYYEEADLCYRMRQAGWRVCFAPAASVTHIGGGSSKGLQGRGRPAELTVQLYAGLAHFYRQHYSPAARLALAGLLEAIAMLRYIRDRLHLLRLGKSSHDTVERDVLQSNLKAWRLMLRGKWMKQGGLASPKPHSQHT